MLKTKLAEKNILSMDELCSTYSVIPKLHDVTDVDVNPEMIKKKICENIQDEEFNHPNTKKKSVLSQQKNATLGQASEHSTGLKKNGLSSSQ